MKKALLHLSDLHVQLHKDLKGVITDPLKSWLTTNTDSQESLDFINEFCSYVKGRYRDYELWLLISGDVADASEEAEYDCAFKFINLIIQGLNIPMENTLIVPGDHDVNRFHCEKAFRDGLQNNSTQKAYEYNEEKFHFFSKFYKKFYKEDFAVDKVIVRKLVFESEKLVILGLNSNYLIDFQGGLGAINISKLNEELDNVAKEFSDFSRIALFHHNIFSSYENLATGQWDKENRVSVLSILKKYNFKCLFYGNEHTRDSLKLGTNEEIYRSDCGSFSAKFPSASFKIYEFETSYNKFSLNLRLFVLQNFNRNDEHSFGKWGVQSNLDLNEVQEIILYQKPAELIIGDDSLDKLASNTDSVKESITKNDILSIEEYANPYYKKVLFDIVKNRKLFHSGHFHWSETSRAHNWIDVSKILNDKKDLYEAKNAIIDVIELCNISEKIDFIIGLGMEGNILSTRASVKYNKPYSFLPYSYRYDEHNMYEKMMYFENNGEYKNILIITDVVNDGRTLRKLINKREPLFFNKVEHIYVVSLFYTGENDNKHVSMLNSEYVKSFDAENDHFESRIEFYYVLDMKVEKCPYGTNFRTECLLVREGLGCVYNFYDEKKAFSKRSESSPS